MRGCHSVSSAPEEGSEPDRGAVCFTFDDFGGEDWLKADAIFRRFHAHGTFFVSREITPEKIAVMRALQSAGHSIGLHGLHHRNASPPPEAPDPASYFTSEIRPQLEICRANGIAVRAFAYPNNRHDAACDRELFRHFDYLRAGWPASGEPCFCPLKDLPEKLILAGGGIGQYYHTELDAVRKLLDRAAEKDALIVFFSHNIAPNADHIHMPAEWLEELLSYARSIRLRIPGAYDLDALRRPGNAASPRHSA